MPPEARILTADINGIFQGVRALGK